MRPSALPSSCPEIPVSLLSPPGGRGSAFVLSRAARVLLVLTPGCTAERLLALALARVPAALPGSAVSSAGGDQGTLPLPVFPLGGFTARATRPGGALASCALDPPPAPSRAPRRSPAPTPPRGVSSSRRAFAGDSSPDLFPDLSMPFLCPGTAPWQRTRAAFSKEPGASPGPRPAPPEFPLRGPDSVPRRLWHLFRPEPRQLAPRLSSQPTSDTELSRELCHGGFAGGCPTSPPGRLPTGGASAPSSGAAGAAGFPRRVLTPPKVASRL